MTDFYFLNYSVKIVRCSFITLHSCKQVVLYMRKTCIESFIEFTIPRAIQNLVMQKVCPNGLHPSVHLARDVLCILLICLVHLILNVPVNNFKVMLGRGHRFLGITSTFGE